MNKEQISCDNRIGASALTRRRLVGASCACVLNAAVPAASKPNDEVRFDFETGDLQGWQVMEGRFGALVTDRSMCRNTPDVPYPKQGRWYLSTTELPDGSFDDGMTGVVESPVFRLTGARITLRVGGGGHPDTYVALCTEDGREIARAHGPFAEAMSRVEWNVPDIVGKRAYLTVYDGNQGAWGHVTLDDVRADGVIDEEATARARASYNRRKGARMAQQREDEAKRAERRARHRKQLDDLGHLTARGRSRIYAGDRLGAISMPVGGIGAGCIQMDGRGCTAVWQIAGNYKPVAVPDSFLAIRARTGAGAPAVRAVQGADAGPFKGMAAVRFRGEYPFGWWTFSDPALPVQVELEVFSPTVPGNARDSAIPCAIRRVTVTNKGARPATVSIMAVQQNAVGYSAAHPPVGRVSEAYGGNATRVVQEPGMTLLEMTADRGAGTMALAAIGRSVTATADCGDMQGLYRRYEETGTLESVKQTGPSPAGSTYDGALAVKLILKPGESRTQTLILTWHFPGVPHGGDIEGWRSEGSMYENWWPDAASVARDLHRRLPDLLKRTRLYHDTLYASNLPFWLLDRISSQVADLYSMTCFWGKDGYFGVWEGCNPEGGCCAGNCSHVWHYAQAHARLWPEIGRTMREQELRCVSPEGAVPHRQPNAPPAFDGQCGSILGAYREHLCSVNGGWLAEQWPRIRAAVNFLIARWDPDEDGVLAGPQWNTLDENLGGSSSWLGSLYVAALRAGARMALLQRDPGSAARWDRIAVAASAKMDATLFNGEYYFQIPEQTPYRDYGSGCHIDQVLGQWWADMLGLDAVLPHGHVQSSLRALRKHNFRYDFVGVTQAPRKFVHDDDAGMQMITWPRGGRPAPEHQMLYADEVMTGFEYAAAASMLYAGLIKESLSVVKAIADRYDGGLRTGLSAGNYCSWGYSGNPFGDDECGKFYGRSMSSWSLLLACQGFVYDGPAGRMGFRPRWRPENHVSFFTAAEGWGLFTQKREGSLQKETLDVKHGRVAVRALVFQVGPGIAGRGVSVSLGGDRLECHVRRTGTDVDVVLAKEALISSGRTLEVRIR